MSKYINIVRIKGDNFLCGHANFPYGTEFDTMANGAIYTIKDDVVYPICFETSERAYTCFAYNEDGRGVERMAIINECIERMAKIVDKYNKFEVFTHDATAMKYKKHPEDLTEWSWDREKVHKAPVEDLERIREIVRGMQ